MADITGQGEVDIAGTTLAVGQTASVLLLRSLTIRFYNPAAYVVTVKRYESLTGTTETLFELTLDAGDTVTDTTPYVLNDGDELIAYSNVPGTSYYFYGMIQ